MKNSFAMLVASFLLLFMSAGNANAQTSLSAAPLLSGCVGACGNTFSGSFTAPATRTYKFRATSSLCPSNQATAAIFVNGALVWFGVIGNGTGFGFNASAGDNVAVFATNSVVNPAISCIWLGEVKFWVH